MEPLYPLATFLLGILVTAALLSSVSRRRAQAAYAKGQADLLPEKAVLSANLDALNRQLEDARRDFRSVQEQLRKEAEKAAAAEQELKRIPVLLTDVKERSAQLAGLQAQNAELQGELRELKALLAKERSSVHEKLALLNETEKRLAQVFQSASAQALQSTLERFQQTAQGDLLKRQQAIAEIVRPVNESLAQLNVNLGEVEKSRLASLSSFSEQLGALIDTQRELRADARNLVHALRAPVTAGRWSEGQLRRLVELASLADHCEFPEQLPADAEDNRLLPDLVIHLPGGRTIAVDAKAPAMAYVEAFEAQDETTHRVKMSEHAAQLRGHITRLSDPAYWSEFDAPPECVIVFLPGETFFSAALEQDPSLLEYGVGRRILLATPTSLIALLRAVQYGWRHDALAENARQVTELGRDLYNRVAECVGFWAEMGNSLDGAIHAYNRAVGSLESRVLTSARRFRELGAIPPADEIDSLNPLDHMPRALDAPEISRAIEEAQTVAEEVRTVSEV